MTCSSLSPSAHRRSLRLRLQRMQRKIAKVEEEIANTQSWSQPEPELLVQEQTFLH